MGFGYLGIWVCIIVQAGVAWLSSIRSVLNMVEMPYPDAPGGPTLPLSPLLPLPIIILIDKVGCVESLLLDVYVDGLIGDLADRQGTVCSWAKGLA